MWAMSLWLHAAAASFSAPSALAFSSSGDLWVGNYTASTLMKFSSAQLQKGGTLEPLVTLDASGVLRGPQGMFFDPKGNLWVSSNESNFIAQFSAAQTVQGGKATPVLRLEDPSLLNPAELTWDAQGSLWVSSFATNQVVRFDASQLAKGGAVPPSRMLGTSDGSLRQAGGLTFDGQGRLWVVSFGRGALLRFSAAQVKAGGKVVPEAVIELPKPTSIAFAPNGDLYVSSYELGLLYRLTPSQLEKSGAVVPSIQYKGLNLPATLAIRDKTVWVAVSGDNTVKGFALETLELRSTLR